MAPFRTGKPNVKALARRVDVDGLVAAAGFQDLIPAAGGAMIDRGAEVRQQAILAFGTVGAEVGTEAVRAGLRDRSDAVRVAAIRVLYAREDATGLAAALGDLPVQRGHSRPLAIRALLELRRPECLPTLADALVRAPGDDPVGDDEAALLTVLLDAEEDSEVANEVVEQLLVALADERDPVADRAEELLVEIAPASTDGVIAELEAGPAPQRAAAVLAQIKDTRALEPLMEGLLHRDAGVRAECAAALGELRDPAAVEALIHASRDPEHRVRAKAGWALDRLGLVALVVGVSTMIRPMILEAMADVEARAGLYDAENGLPRKNGAAGQPEFHIPVHDVEAGPRSEPTNPQALGRLVAETDNLDDARDF
jgi:HEAT repeat protein